MTWWTRLGALCALVAASIVLRLWTSSHVYVVSNDSASVYLYEAQEMLKGNWQDGISTVFPPGYPLLVSMLARIHLDLEESGKLVSVLCGGLLVLPVFFLTRRIYGERPAWLAGSLVAANATLIGASSDALSDSTFVLILMSAALAGESVLRRGSKFGALVAGLLFGAGYLVRPEAVGFLGMFVATLLMARLLDRGDLGVIDTSRRESAWLVSLCVGFLVISLPYLMFYRTHTGRWGLTGKTMLNLLAHDVTETGEQVDYERARYALAENGRQLQIEVDARQSAAKFLWKTRSRQVRKYLRNMASVLLRTMPQVINPLFWLLGCLLLCCEKRSHEMFAWNLYLGAFFVLPIVCYPLFWVEPRYFVSSVPIAAIWASAGLVLMDEVFRVYSDTGMVTRPKGFLLPAVIIVMLTGFWPVIDMLRGKPSNYPVEQREAGQYLRAHGRANARIISRKALVAFYAGGVPLPLPFGSLDEVLNYSRWVKADYLVVDERYSVALRPQLKSLLDQEQQLPGLTTVYSANPGPGLRLVIFDLRPGGT